MVGGCNEYKADSGCGGGGGGWRSRSGCLLSGSLWSLWSLIFLCWCCLFGGPVLGFEPNTRQPWDVIEANGGRGRRHRQPEQQYNGCAAELVLASR